MRVVHLQGPGLKGVSTFCLSTKKAGLHIVQMRIQDKDKEYACPDCWKREVWIREQEASGDFIATIPQDLNYNRRDLFE